MIDGASQVAPVRMWLDDIRAALCVLELLHRVQPGRAGDAVACRDDLARVLFLVEDLKPEVDAAFFAACAAQSAGIELVALAMQRGPDPEAPARLAHAMWLLGKAEERAMLMLQANRARSGRPLGSGRKSAVILAELDIDDARSDDEIADAVSHVVAVDAGQVGKVRKRRRKLLPT